jgi:hypothetical protein
MAADGLEKGFVYLPVRIVRAYIALVLINEMGRVYLIVESPFRRTPSTSRRPRYLPPRAQFTLEVFSCASSATVISFGRFLAYVSMNAASPHA